MRLDSKIYIAGHNGLVGSALRRLMVQRGYSNLLYRTSKELDLRDQKATDDFFANNMPEYVILAAAKVGGIQANYLYPAEFIYDNLQIQNNVINAAFKYKVKKLVFLGSSCIYPKFASQPIKEEYLLTGPLESTNEPYAVAKIAGIKLCESYNRQFGTNFISVMPTNLYGPNDNFDLENSHVLPALIRKFHEAKISGSEEVVVWGSGEPRREFLHVDDLADAVFFLLKEYDGTDIVNVGVGYDVSIKDLAFLIKDIIGFTGQIRFDLSKPDGTPRKLLDVTKLSSLGWVADISLEEGIRETYEWFVKEYHTVQKK